MLFGFADIWKRNYHGEPMCIKTVWTRDTLLLREVKKVCSSFNPSQRRTQCASQIPNHDIDGHMCISYPTALPVIEEDVPITLTTARASVSGWDKTFCLSIIVPAKRYPLPEAQADLVSCGRLRVDDSVGGVCPHPRIPQYFWPPWYVYSASSSALMAHFRFQACRGQLRSISQKRRNSRTWWFSPNRGVSNGSP